jgi:hypothetical protein
VAINQGRETDRVFLGLLAKFDKPLSSSPNAGNYAPKVFSKRPDREGFTKRDFERSMHFLTAAGNIKDVQYGRPSDARFRIVAMAETDADGDDDST